METKFYDRDIQIMKQSQSKLALDFLTQHGIKPTVLELHTVTEVFIQMCLHEMNDDLKKRIKALDAWIVKKQSNTPKL